MEARRLRFLASVAVGAVALLGVGCTVSATYLGLFLIVLAGEAGLPMLAPVELALIAAGIAVAQESASLPAVVAIVLTADLLGTLVFFLLVRASSSARRAPLRRCQAIAERAATRIGGASPVRAALGRAVPFVRVPEAGRVAMAGDADDCSFVKPIARFAWSGVVGL